METWKSGKAGAAASVIVIGLLVTACGGGGGSETSTPLVPAASQTVQQATAPDTRQLAAFADEGLNRMNLRRQQIGLTALTRDTLLDRTAAGHSNYQKLNNEITHVQTRGNPGFTGEEVHDRLQAVGYTFTQSSFTFGEVISATTDGSGERAAENLIGAIYHRYAIFEPMFRQAGAGAATVNGGYTYFTVNFAADGLRSNLSRGQLVTYPSPNQQDIETMVFSDRETPDPVPDRNEVGYPISVHANIVSEVAVQTFTVRPRGGTPLATRLQTAATDGDVPESAAAIIPLAPLTAGTTYDVQFVGSVDNLPVNLSWSFTTAR